MRSTREKFKMFKVLIIVFIALLFVSLTFVIKTLRESMISLFKREEITQSIEYEIYSNENDLLRILVTATDSENGIKELIYPNGDKLQCNGKTQVGVDYVIQENGIYEFIAKTTTGKQIKETIIVDDNYRANEVIPIEKIQEIKTEKDYRVDYNYKKIEFDCYYAIGANNNEWISAERDIINIDEYDAFLKEQLNEDRTITLKLKKEDKFGNKVEIHYKLNEFNVPEDLYRREDEILEGDSIIQCVRDNEIKSGNYILKINEEEYPAEIYNYDDDVNYITHKNLGTIENDRRMVIMKYNKNLTVNEENLVTTQARKKGMFICVEGELRNVGEISMTARGANAEGQDVFLWKHESGAYEYVPAAGESGGTAVTASAWNGRNIVKGNNGSNGLERRTGGGGSGGADAISSDNFNAGVTSGAGALGTSYSGGTGGGSSYQYLYNNNGKVGKVYYQGYPGNKNGGAGGNGHLGGTGNPGGEPNGTIGTGGLLIIYANKFNNTNNITSRGTESGSNEIAGASGGGTINIFINELIGEGIIEATGGTGGQYGGDGGSGCVTLQNINIKSPKITVDEITGTSFKVNIEDNNLGMKGIVYDYYINDELKIENTESLSETISSLNYATKYKVYVKLKYGDNSIITSNEVVISTPGITRPDLPGYIGTNLEYPILTKNGMVNVKYENVNDESDYIYGLDLNVECSAVDALDKVAYDGNENTYFEADSKKNKFYFGKDIDIYQVCFKVVENYVGTIITSDGYGYIRSSDGEYLESGIFHITYYGKGTEAWQGKPTVLQARTCEIYYNENL